MLLTSFDFTLRGPLWGPCFLGPVLLNSMSLGTAEYLTKIVASSDLPKSISLSCVFMSCASPSENLADSVIMYLSVICVIVYLAFSLECNLHEGRDFVLPGGYFEEIITAFCSPHFSLYVFGTGSYTLNISLPWGFLWVGRRHCL